MANATLLSNTETTLEAAEADLSRLLAEESSVQTELDQLKKKVAELETRRTDIGGECHKLSHIIAQKLCRNFVNKFYVTLPSELREMVYDYVWDQPMLRLAFDDVTLYEKTSNNPRDMVPFSPMNHGRWRETDFAPRSLPCTQDVCRCFDWWELPFWVQRQYVGMDVAIEVVKAYYRNIRSLRLESDHLEDLTRLLSQDHFHLDIKPLDHIRRLEIPLKQEVLIGEGKGGRYHLQSMNGLDIFQRHLEVLLDVHVKKGFQLTMKLTWHASHIYCMPALERSRAVVDKLLKEGAKVTVLAWDSQSLKEYDVSDYYTLSSVDWQKRWIWKVKKDHRRSGYISYHDDLNSLADDFFVDEDLMDDSEKAAEQEECENEQDKAFVKALAGLEGPTRSVPMSYAPTAWTSPNVPEYLHGGFGVEDFL